MKPRFLGVLELRETIPMCCENELEGGGGLKPRGLCTCSSVTGMNCAHAQLACTCSLYIYTYFRRASKRKYSRV